VLDKTGSLPVSFPVQIIYRIVSLGALDISITWKLRTAWMARQHWADLHMYPQRQNSSTTHWTVSTKLNRT